MGEDDDMEFLPLDIISCILLWLPISSILRFKSVSKSWLSIIESPDFVHRHIHATKQQWKLLLMTTSQHPFNNPQHISLIPILDSDEEEEEVSLDFPVIHSHYQVTPVELVGYCNGIICLRQHRRVCLWNPATKQSIILPPLPVVVVLVSWIRPCGFPTDGSIWFGFDPKANDYKVVTMNMVNDDYVFHIYSLSSDSWRKFEGLPPPNMAIVSSINTLYRDRFCCWLTETDFRYYFVYMFDFSDEVFTTIPTPSGLDFYTLFTITENIACAGQLRKEVDDVLMIAAQRNTDYEIWMLCDYQVKESWTKLYSINLDHPPKWMTWVSDDDADFLLFQIGNQLGMYDLVAQEVTDFPFYTGDLFEVVMYRASLLSIKRGNGATDGLTSMDRNRRMLITQSIAENNIWGDSDVHKAVMNRILLWLPALSLQRFKSVCKSWHSLILSSDFITQHLTLHQHPNTQDNLSLILHSDRIFSHPLFEDSSHHSCNASCTCLLSVDKLELLDFPTRENFSITTSFNGIICLRNGEYDDCCLWNPVTKQFRDLCPDRVQNYGETFHLGFGIDTKTNNYKLVRFFRGDGNVAQIYCLSTDSWRTISDEILPTIMWIYSGLDAPYRDGIYCWLVDIDCSWTILSFDFGTENFRTIPLPDIITRWSSIAVLRDKIVCISLGESDDHYSDDTNSWNCEIWMMNEYGVTESWCKLCTVGPFSKDWSFKRCYSKKSGDYMLLLNDGQLYEYNLVTQERERLPCQIQGSKDYQVVAYEPSLVPIK